MADMKEDVKIYLSVDFEGGACIVGQSETTLTASKQYEFSRREMTAEANAAAQGSFEGGATEVTVDDCHGSGLNLLYDELDSRVKVLCGVPRPRRFPSLDCTFSGMMLIGYHPMAGVAGGVLSHTYSSTGVQNMWLNGRRVGEIAIDACLAGSLGVPVLLVSSCEAGVQEATDVIPGVRVFATKKGYSRNCALSLSPSATREGIRKAARMAVEERSAGKPLVMGPPYELKKEAKFESLIDRVRPPFERVGPRTVVGRSDDLFGLM